MGDTPATGALRDARRAALRVSHTKRATLILSGVAHLEDDSPESLRVERSGTFAQHARSA